MQTSMVEVRITELESSMMKMLKEFNFIKIFEDACIYKKEVGALRHISNTLCRRHIGHWKIMCFS
jgi:hypothetical protein